MASLERFLELVHRTGLPTILPCLEGEEPCVLIPLHIYEQLSADEMVARSASVTVRDKVAISEIAPVTVSDPPSPLSLQDLLKMDPLPQVVLPISPDMAQIKIEDQREDRFAFEGSDIRILPKIKEKSSSDQMISDEFGPTLA